jgi:hypothetical protein
MRKLAIVLALFLLPGCSTLGGNQLTPQGEAAILALIQIATGVAAGTTPIAGGQSAACAQLALLTPVGSCLPAATNDPAAIQAALNSCLMYSVEAAVIFRMQSRLCGPPK